MDYSKAKSKLVYSSQMRTMQYTVSHVKGTFTIGIYAYELESDSSFLALINGMDADYCRFLAIAKCMCEYYFVENREEATDDKVEEYLNSMLGEPIEDNVVRDIMYLFTKTGNRSPEATAVERSDEIIRLWSRLTEEEKEKIGDDLLKSTLKKSMKKDTDGSLIQSELYYEIFEKTRH